MATIDDFEKLDVRVGKVIDVKDFPEAKKPAYKLKIDFGDETKTSSVQIVKNYSKDELLNKLVLCVVNFPPRQIGNFSSEVLTLGVPDKDNEVVLIEPDKEVPLGVKLY